MLFAFSHGFVSKPIFPHEFAHTPLLGLLVVTLESIPPPECAHAPVIGQQALLGDAIVVQVVPVSLDVEAGVDVVQQGLCMGCEKIGMESII